MSITVRDIQEEDYDRWLELGAGYLAFYKTDLPQEITDETWRRVLDPARSDMFGLVAEMDGEVVGFTICVVHPGTWTAKDICYLEDLFVDERVRGQGAGRALIEAVYDKARKLNYHRVYWRTHTDNKAARALYDKVADNNNWVMYEHYL